MTTSEPIPLIRQIEVKPVLDVLRECGAPIHRLLTAAKLPQLVEDEPVGFVSARAMLAFLEIGARSQDIPDLGWRAAIRARIERMGAWGLPVARCQTLGAAISSFCRLYALEISFVELGLSAGEEYAWLWRRRTTRLSGWQGDSQGQQFMLGSMIQVVRQAAGSEWMPPCIRVESGDSSWLPGARDLGDCRVEFGGPVLAIAVPYALLDQPTRRPPRQSMRKASSHPLPAEDLAGSLRQAIAPIVSERPVTIELAAEIAGTSARTLRRRLAEQETSWRQQLDRVRFERCERMLLDPSVPLVEISAKLGYSDPAHFTRSFRRWTGEAPSSYRARRV